MSSPSDMHISPPASPPPSPPAAASAEKKEAVLFELRFNQVRLLQRALSSLVSTATGPDDGSPALGDFHILTDDVVFIVAKTATSPNVDTCLALKQFTPAVVPAGLVLCLNLRLLEDAMAHTVGNRQGLMTLCLKGEKEGEIVFSLTQENGNEESSVIPVISTHVPDPVKSAFWSGLGNRVVLSFQITVQSLRQVMVGLKGESPVQILATENQVWFKLGGYKAGIRGQNDKYQILRPSQDYPLIMEFHSFHPEDAILNAAALAAEFVVFHLTSDSIVLQFSVNGVGSILFCFDAIRCQASRFLSSSASTPPA